jgi:PKD repeat protein
MKLIYFITTLLFINTTCVLGQAKYYSTNFGWASIHNGRKVLQKHNGQYILACEVKNNSTNKWNSYITVLDSLSNIVSNFDDTNEDYQSGIFDMTEQNDDFVAVGVLVPANNTVARSYVLRLKSNNELEKYNLGDTTKHTIARTCATTMDNGLLLAGNIDQIGSTPQKLYLIGLDSNYSTIWDTTYYSFVENNNYEDIIALPDGTFYGLATIKDDYWQQANIALLHLSATGIPISIQEYNLGGRDLARCLIPTNDGGMLFSASSYPNNDPTEVVQNLYKLDSAGETQWINNADYFIGAVISSLVQLADSTYIVAGSDYSAGPNYLQGFVAKLDTNGSVLWRRTYGGDRDEYIYDLIINNHNSTGKDGYVMCGRTESTDLGVPLGNANVYFLKTNCMGLLTEPQAQFSYTKPSRATPWLSKIYRNMFTPTASTVGITSGTLAMVLTSAEQNPTHTYTAAGAYNISLTAVVCSDTSRYTQTICVGSPSFAPLFSYQTNSLTATFINQSTGGSRKPR